MTTQQLAQKILDMIEKHKRENANIPITPQWRARGALIDAIEQLCFREAIKESSEAQAGNEKDQI